MKTVLLFFAFLWMGSVKAQTQVEDCKVEMPNTYSPNTQFTIYNTCKLSAFKLSVLSRWGIQVYETTTLDDETIIKELKKLSSGTYYYILLYTPTGAEEKKVTGYVNVLN